MQLSFDAFSEPPRISVRSLDYAVIYRLKVNLWATFLPLW